MSLYHELLPADRHALMVGSGSSSTTEQLRASVRSIRLVLLRVIVTRLMAGSSSIPDRQLLAKLSPINEVWELIVAVEQQNRAIVDELLAYPEVGSWGMRLLDRLDNNDPLHPVPLWAEVGYLHTLAAAMAMRAGVPYRLVVPMYDGAVVVPGTQLMRSPLARDARELWDVCVLSDQAPQKNQGLTPYPLETIRAQAQALDGTVYTLEVTLDDVGPYRDFQRVTPPAVLTKNERAHLKWCTERAWEILVRLDPMRAEAIASGLRSISLTPLKLPEQYRAPSASAGAAFGTFSIGAMPDNPVGFAETIVHESAHNWFDGLRHLYPLVTLDTEGNATELFHAPWRDDPRPLAGLLNGLYAFRAITAFWRDYRLQPGVGQRPDFEFGLWRAQVSTVATGLLGHPRLTRHGKQLLECIVPQAAAWNAIELPEPTMAAVTMAVADHLAAWRAYHLHPDPQVVENLANAWCCHPAPPMNLREFESSLRTDTSVPRLDGRAVLQRWLMTEPSVFAGYRPWPRQSDGKFGVVDVAYLRQTQPFALRVSDIGPADVALVLGDWDVAAFLYGETLKQTNSPTAWVGLGLALRAMNPGPVADLLLDTPHLARAVAEKLKEWLRSYPNPQSLASWLAKQTS